VLKIARPPPSRKLGGFFMPSETIFRRHFSLILLGEWLTLNVSTFIIQFIGASDADTGKAPPKRGLYRE
ncbi:hypothetical protein CXF00_001452, partial [Neisseria gonorrhoeae]